jgi:hypothetical protein
VLVASLIMVVPLAAQGQAPAPVEPPAAPAAELPAAPAVEPAPGPEAPPVLAPAPLPAPVVVIAPVVEVKEEKVDKKDAPPKVSLTPGKGFTIASDDGRFSVTIRSRIQLRETLTHNADKNTNETNVKTMRFVTHGHLLTPDFKFLIQLAFGGNDYDKDNLDPVSSSPIFDAYVEYVKLRDLNIRFGQYFVPFDRARTIREFALQFVDRQITVRELSLDRDMGVMLSSNDLLGWGGRLGYHVFVGGGEGRNRVGGSALGPLLVGRLVFKPMGNFDDDQEADIARQAPHMAIGVAGGYNYKTNRANSTYATTYQGSTFNYTHAAADLVFKAKGFSFLAEGLYREASKNNHRAVDDKGKAILDAKTGMQLEEHSRSGYGYFIQAGQMVYKNAELTARWDDLYAKHGTDSAWKKMVQAQGRQFGVGANYYFNGHQLKLQGDYFYIFGTQNTDKPNHAVRLQIDASF